jgi:CRISPR/Cas system CSM-associated protein Csm4 (group 5 of RAMP superfamily)
LVQSNYLYEGSVFELRSDTDSKDMSDEKDKHLVYVLTYIVHVRMQSQPGSATTYPNTTYPSM